MEAVRKIINASMLLPIIDLPWAEKDMQVEVIVLPLEKTTTHRKVAGKSLKGCLKKYANPVLLKKESSAWEKHIIEKYGAI